MEHEVFDDWPAIFAGPRAMVLYLSPVVFGLVNCLNPRKSYGHPVSKHHTRVKAR